MDDAVDVGEGDAAAGVCPFPKRLRKASKITVGAD
ncbi:MAG: hypothetical protein DVB23_002031 [Verrucomicrobia bacterium]|nr:MAG: hypothetical protein DVB23_002031 [Verrucomicrobiota bacterium]